jgi:hypothetical protein
MTHSLRYNNNCFFNQNEFLINNIYNRLDLIDHNRDWSLSLILLQAKSILIILKPNNLHKKIMTNIFVKFISASFIIRLYLKENGDKAKNKRERGSSNEIWRPLCLECSLSMNGIKISHNKSNSNLDEDNKLASDY